DGSTLVISSSVIPSPPSAKRAARPADRIGAAEDFCQIGETVRNFLSLLDPSPQAPDVLIGARLEVQVRKEHRLVPPERRKNVFHHIFRHCPVRRRPLFRRLLQRGHKAARVNVHKILPFSSPPAEGWSWRSGPLP